MKITIYELLGMVKDGKAPKKIKIDGEIYELWISEIDGKIDYKTFDNGFLTSYIGNNYLDCIREEVEIIEEEKKIPLKINKIVPSQNYVISDSKNNSVDERLEIIRKRLYANELYMLDIANTLNEIIDYLKSKGDE